MKKTYCNGPLKLDYVTGKLAHIEEIKGDDEYAHSAEDALWEVVLEAIAERCEDPHLLAREALKTRAIKFQRWCA